MHCLGAGAGGQAGSSGFGSRGGIISVVRALGVIVCEGRIQGPPRGYKEGPHCVAPLQSAPNNHNCEKDNYLCDRYHILVREITERISTGLFLCVEVVLCSNCPCGLSKAKCKNPIYSALSTPSWQQSSEMLLEYWCIGVVPSKYEDPDLPLSKKKLSMPIRIADIEDYIGSCRTPEVMNSQGLYQAVRSRLHFSQVAAWWSRSSGTQPNYVATRVVAHTGDHLRKFREAPIEHTFPLAGIGDGNSIKVTVWALPRTEECPVLTCSLHPLKDKIDDTVARAVTPTKTIPIPSSSNVPEVHVLPALVDDRLQTPCNQPGKHHCRCEEDDGCPPSPSIRPIGERKRRRSLPCRQPESTPPMTSTTPLGLTSVWESHGRESKILGSKYQSERIPCLIEENDHKNVGYEESLERSFRKQLSIEEQQEGNVEKRYKRSAENSPDSTNGFSDSFVPLDSPVPSQLIIPWMPNTKCKSPSKRVNLVENPLNEQFNDIKPGMSTCTPHTQTTITYSVHRGGKKTETICLDDWKKWNVNNNTQGRELSQMMSKMSFPAGKESIKEDGGLLDWISRVPKRVLGNTEANKMKVITNGSNCHNGDLKLRNNLELSQREFDEVLAVLRARTPSGRRRAPLKTIKKREKMNDVSMGKINYRANEESTVPSHTDEVNQVLESRGSCLCKHCKKNNCSESSKKEIGTNNKADVLLGAILRTSKVSQDRKGLADISNGIRSIPSNRVETVISDETDKSVEEISLPMALNKKLSRLKQLFKLEQADGQSNSLLFADSRVKKKLDYSGMTSAHENSKPHSTNEGKCSETNLRLSTKEEYIEKEESEKDKTVPSAKDQERFRRSLENAASMVFHSRTGLPLTSSPAPLRRGSCCFDFDSSLNSVSSKRSALFELNTPPSPGAISLEECDREMEMVCDGEETLRRRSTSRNRPQSHALLGNFEESALNGRLEPVSTVHGFAAELGASGSFCPKHRKLPVTVFFYTLGDNDKISSPYLAHINLGKKGYQVPRNGTIQVTLLNPLGTVVKMFVVTYDLSDMPPRSHTFLRQRTLRDQTLRYLIHLRFTSSKSGRIYLHTDIRMIICRKSDVDTASDFKSESSKEFRSYIHGPTNPKFSPRC